MISSISLIIIGLICFLCSVVIYSGLEYYNSQTLKNAFNQTFCSNKKSKIFYELEFANQLRSDFTTQEFDEVFINIKNDCDLVNNSNFISSRMNFEVIDTVDEGNNQILTVKSLSKDYEVNFVFLDKNVYISSIKTR